MASTRLMSIGDTRYPDVTLIIPIDTYMMELALTTMMMDVFGHKEDLFLESLILAGYGQDLKKASLHMTI